MASSAPSQLSRRALLGAFAATAVTAAPLTPAAAGILRGAGDFRRLSMRNPHTGERLETIYWIDGAYIDEALREIDFFMRDWRKDATIGIDTRTLDVVAATWRLLETEEPFALISGYRTPATNAMLRKTSSGVARKSRHIKGQANDLHLASRSVDQLARAGRACAAGGVGRYTASSFVHLDCGPVRSWGS